jgi:hypothetical protein
LNRRDRYSADDLLDRPPILIVDFQFQRLLALGVMLGVREMSKLSARANFVLFHAVRGGRGRVA